MGLDRVLCRESLCGKCWNGYGRVGGAVHPTHHLPMTVQMRVLTTLDGYTVRS